MSKPLQNQYPHRRMEAWKWTDVSRVVEEQSGLSVEGLPKFTPPSGVSITQSVGEASDHVMGKLAASFSSQCWNIHVPEDANPTDPLLIENLNQGHAHIAISLDANAALTLIEHHKGDAKSFVNLDMQIHLGEGAKLTRIIMQDDPETTVRIATSTITAGAKAELEQYALSFGGALTRLETRLYGQGGGIEAHINGAYLLGDKRHTDMTSHIELTHPDCMIRQAVKGVVSDKARGVFQGKFHVHRAAQHTDAEMRHDALMLSETSEIRAKPELEIYADDVACAHGNTIGALDESALFYMRQRGIPEATARAMLTEAFISDVFDDLEDEALQASLVEQIQKWLS